MSQRNGYDDCFVVEGKMALPNTYFAGRVGSAFILSLRDKRKITGVRCGKCGRVFVPPREYCETCFIRIDDNREEISSEGIITGFTMVNYHARHLPRKSPFILALIKLDGADTPFAHIVEGIDFDDISVGLRVKAVFSSITTSTILDIDHFEPVLQANNV